MTLRRFPSVLMAFLLSLSGISMFMMPTVAETVKTSADNCVETDHGTWCYEVAGTDANGKFDGFAIGEVTGDDQDDIIGVGLTGKVWVMTKKDGSWVQNAIWTAPGSNTEMMIAAVGELDSTHTGNEIVVVGRVLGDEDGGEGGVVRMLYNDGTSWKAQTIWGENANTSLNPQDMTHGVDIGEFYAPHPGPEVAVVDFSGNLTMVYKDGSEWKHTWIARAYGKARTVVIGDGDPGHSGNELVWASKDGNISVSYWDGTGWKTTVILEDHSSPGSGFSRCAIGDINNDGANEILAGGDNSDFYVIENEGGTWKSEKVFDEPDKTRATWIGDVWDGNGANMLEGISGGYSGQINMHVWESNAWTHTKIFEDPGRLHHALIGDIDPDHPGKEILTGGYGQKAFVVAQYHPFYTMSTTVTGVTVTTETSASVNINLTGNGFYSGKVTLTVDGLPANVTATFNAAEYTVSGTTIGKLDLAVPMNVMPGTTKFTVKAMDGKNEQTKELTLKVDRSFGMKATSDRSAQEVEATDIGVYNITINNSGSIPDTFTIAFTSSSENWTGVTLSKTSVDLDAGEEVTIKVEIAVPKDASEVTDETVITVGSALGGQTNTVTLRTTVPKKDDGGGGGGTPFLENALLVSAMLLAALLFTGLRRRE